MTAPIPFTLTNESITVVLDGSPRTIHKGSAQYPALRQALFDERWDEISKLLTVDGALAKWFAGTQFVSEGGAIRFIVQADGAVADLDVPASLSKRLQAMVANGEDPTPLINFYTRLAKNPSWRSRTQLFDFLAHCSIPIEPDGTFLAYKGVREDMKDVHSGKFDNSPGQRHAMPRSMISDDPEVACHVGFHVGAKQYATNFGPTHVICRVDPEHVVCVPKDESWQKMRVCEYVVVGFWNGQDMPSTTFSNDVDPAAEREMDEEVEDDAGDADWESDNIATEQPDHIDEVKPKATPKATPKASKPIKNRITKGSQLGRLTPAKLMNKSIDELRKYASGHLKIVGASKMSGGKTSLVAAIMKARKAKRR